MSNRKSKKHIITQVVLDAIPAEQNNYKELTVEQLVFRWWQTGRAGEGLRLTEEGMNAFTLADIAHYDYPVHIQRDSKQLVFAEFTIGLGKKLKCPYYIGVNLNTIKSTTNKTIYIRIYDHKIAMMISLYGNMNEYLDSIMGKN